MPDYSQTILYKLCCKDLNINDIYIGHTTNFRQRKYDHKGVCNNVSSPTHHLKVYQVIRENGGWDNWDMIQIEVYDAKDVNDAKARERYWIEQMKPSLNCIIPLNTKQESDKAYREANKEQINAYKKERIPCDICGGMYGRSWISRHKKTQHNNL